MSKTNLFAMFGPFLQQVGLLAPKSIPTFILCQGSVLEIQKECQLE
jgi:hypothetical protein